MTCKQIQRQLLIDRYRQSFAIPNYTPKGWFECDVFEQTASGYFVEYEVKVSRSDFLADAKKFRQRWSWGDQAAHGAYTTEVKHDLLTNKDVRGPARFWYVCPEGLISESDLPPFAGLIHIRTYDRRIYEHVVVKAPQLHRQRADDSIKKHAESVTYWRFNGLFCKLHKYNEPISK